MFKYSEIVNGITQPDRYANMAS